MKLMVKSYQNPGIDLFRATRESSQPRAMPWVRPVASPNTGAKNIGLKSYCFSNPFRAACDQNSLVRKFLRIDFKFMCSHRCTSIHFYGCHYFYSTLGHFEKN